MDFRRHTWLLWLLAQLFMAFWDCCFLFCWPKNMCAIAGLFWPPSASGLQLHCRYICISIPPGRTHIPHLRWLYSYGIGTAREELATIGQYVALGLIAGLMIDVYFPNGVFLLLPLIEALRQHLAPRRAQNVAQAKILFSETMLAVALMLAVLPTLITRSIVYGGLFKFGAYTATDWIWTAPHWWQVLFSSDHGAFSWTPILALALLGLFSG